MTAKLTTVSSANFVAFVDVQKRVAGKADRTAFWSSRGQQVNRDYFRRGNFKFLKFWR